MSTLPRSIRQQAWSRRDEAQRHDLIGMDRQLGLVLLHGTAQHFVAGMAYPFDDQNGRLPFGTVSSFRIDSSC